MDSKTERKKKIITILTRKQVNVDIFTVRWHYCKWTNKLRWIQNVNNNKKEKRIFQQNEKKIENTLH